jgi:hypothetical protein
LEWFCSVSAWRQRQCCDPNDPFRTVMAWEDIAIHSESSPHRPNDGCGLPVSLLHQLLIRSGAAHAGIIPDSSAHCYRWSCVPGLSVSEKTDGNMRCRIEFQTKKNRIFPYASRWIGHC